MIVSHLKCNLFPYLILNIYLEYMLASEKEIFHENNSSSKRQDNNRYSKHHLHSRAAGIPFRVLCENCLMVASWLGDVFYWKGISSVHVMWPEQLDDVSKIQWSLSIWGRVYLYWDTQETSGKLMKSIKKTIYAADSDGEVQTMANLLAN